MKNVFLLCVIVFASASCKPKEDTTNKENALFLSIEHSWANESLNLQSGGYKNPAGDSLTMGRLTYLLSEFKLKREDGIWVEIPNSYAFVNAASNENEVKFSDIPPGHYTAIQYRIGLIPEINHSNPNLWPAGHPLDPLTNLMHWSWSEGYIFIAIEGFYYTTGSPKLYSLHIAFEENSVAFELEREMHINGAHKLVLNFDAREIFTNPMNYSFMQHGTVTHSGPDDPLAGLVSGNLHSVFSIKSYE